MSNIPYSRIRPPQNLSRQIDVHQLQLLELQKQDARDDYNSANPPRQTTGFIPRRQFEGVVDTPPLPDTGALTNTGRGIIDRYIYCDSVAKDSASSLSQGKLAFNITKLNQNKSLDQIIEMQIGDFFFPNKNVDTTLYPSYFFFNRLYILVQEMAAQSVLAQESNKYHFEKGIASAGIANEATDIGMNLFIFPQPYRDLTISTFAFTAPPYFKTVVFDQDLYIFNAVPGSAPARITTTDSLNMIPTADPGGLPVTIYCTDFYSGIGDIDAKVNSPEGHLVKVIDQFTLEFNAILLEGFDFSTIGTAIPGKFLVGYRRIAFGVRYRTITDVETNRIIPV